MTGPTLAFSTQQASPSDNTLRTGTVYGVNGDRGTLRVDVAGRILELNRMTSWPVPAVGSTVALMRQDSTWLVLGAITTGRPSRAGIVGAGVSTSSALLTSSGTEVALGSWDQEPEFLAQTDRIYRASWHGRTHVSGGTIAQVIGTLRLRLGSASTTGEILGSWQVDALTNFSGVSVNGWGLFRVLTGADFRTPVSITLVKSAGLGSNINFGADAVQLITVTIEDVTDDANGDPGILTAVALPVAV